MPVAGQLGGAGSGDQVAVFIDLENLAIGAGEVLPGQADTIPYKALELLCRDYGDTSIRRAYADWSRPEFAEHQFNLAQNGITLIQVTRYGAQQKNAADILMAVDAKFPIRDVERLVREAMEESPDASATGSWLKSKMLALDPSFDEHNYNARSFRALLSRLPEVVEVKKDRSSPDMRVTLVTAKAAPAPKKTAARSRKARSPAPGGSNS